MCAKHCPLYKDLDSNYNIGGCSEKFFHGCPLEDDWMAIRSDGAICLAKDDEEDQ